MFCGIIEYLGTVSSVRALGLGRSLTIEAGVLAAETRPGDSLAVNGVCLTATAVKGKLVETEAVAETLTKTNLGSLSSGSRVNLERPLAAGGRIHGHLVQGHVDTVTRVASLEKLPESVLIGFAITDEIRPFVVERGSVAVDGVSLSVARLDESKFTCSLIGYTLEHTTLGQAGRGTLVNIETDIIGKYVMSALKRTGAAGAGISEEKLRGWGY